MQFDLLTTACHLDAFNCQRPPLLDERKDNTRLTLYASKRALHLIKGRLPKGVLCGRCLWGFFFPLRKQPFRIRLAAQRALDVEYGTEWHHVIWLRSATWEKSRYSIQGAG